VLCGALLNASHPLFANRGYQHGRVVLISIYTALVSMATGVLMGVGVLDEAWPARPLMSMLRHLAFVFIIGGVASLNWQNIKALGKRQMPVRLSEVISSSTRATTPKPIAATTSPKMRGTAAAPLPLPTPDPEEEEKGHNHPL